MFNTIMSAAQLQSSLDDPNWVILDCRFNLMEPDAGYAAYMEGHIPGAFYLHLDEHLSSPITGQSGRHPLPNPQELAELLGRCGVTRKSQVVVYDDCAGMMAARCWWLLRYIGHDQVSLLDGGIQSWGDAGGELTQQQPVYKKECCSVELRPSANLSVDQLVSALAEGDITLVDARAAERFRGEVEPIDPVAGHIPDALNRPLMDNLRDGYFKSAETLRQEWLALMGDQRSERVVHMCGSGVTACHNQLAMEIAGLKGSRLYAGSWSEWIRNPARPVAKG